MAGEHSTSAASLKFPPGFRFHPSDEELIVHYLQNKVISRPLPASVIAEVDLYKYNPWELPYKAPFGEDEWYFFSPRDRKYPNGERPNRAAGLGYWKATGTDKPILSSFGSKNLGVKKALVFYTGRPPKGVKTDWMMNEYRLLDTAIKPRLKGSMRLDDWVLCRVRLKGNMPKSGGEVYDSYSAEPKTTAALPTYTNQKNEMIADCLYKDCPLLAFLLSGQTPPPMETNSSVSCQESNNDNIFTSIYEDGSDKLDSPSTVSSFGTYFNSLKMKPNEKNGYENLLPLSKKPYGVIIDEDLPPSKTLPNNDLKYSSQCQEGIYPNVLYPTIDFQEFNDLALTGNIYSNERTNSSLRWSPWSQEISDYTA